MKISLPVRLGIFVFLLFAAVITACLLWTPVKIRYYVSLYRSPDAEKHEKGRIGLISTGRKGRKILGEELLRLLLSEYESYELPLPPEDSRLVKFVSAWSHSGSEKEDTPIYGLGFLLQEFPENNSVLILVGTNKLHLYRKHNECLSVTPTANAADSDSGFSYLGDNRPNHMAKAIQCYSCGHKALSLALLKRHFQKMTDEYFTRETLEFGQFPWKHIATLAWLYRQNELGEPGSNRSRILKQMNYIVSKQPEVLTEKRRHIIDDLEKTLKPFQSPKGSVGELIDNLTGPRSHSSQNQPDTEEKKTAYDKLAEQGFDAVPALIDHMNDNRLTRILQINHWGGTYDIVRVKDRIRRLLSDLSGKKIDEHNASRADALAWWKEAKALGEEQYLIKNLFPADAKDNWLNKIILTVITAKYPKRLPKLYRRLLDEKPYMQSWPLTDAVAESSLPREKKIELFTYAGRHSNLEHRRAAFWKLIDLDNKLFIRMLLDTFKELPATPKEPYWKCPESGVTLLALKTSDQRVWDMLKKVAKRSDVGLRMEIMQNLTQIFRKDMNCTDEQRLELLVEFLDDEAVPDFKGNPKMFDGPHAGFHYEVISVRDLAALEIARVLELDISPDKNWSAAKWDEFHIEIRKVLENRTKKRGNSTGK